ncbi:MAG: AbrB/MazE/SpoVT family DNA-binding domain-containing protein [Candidatus Woesearchaeota archaeon]|jgi:bifunctional DNA-binding transcriptional regulator/antitoxin component of YhaV-PrlF toxin-antitoxin module
MDIAITKMSSKGQIVLPFEMRKELAEGEKILIIKAKDQWILKKASDIDEIFDEDLIFAKRTEDAYRRYQKGEFIETNDKDFLKELKKW